jgi:hypothetical protein
MAALGKLGRYGEGLRMSGGAANDPIVNEDEDDWVQTRLVLISITVKDEAYVFIIFGQVHRGMEPWVHIDAYTPS